MKVEMITKIILYKGYLQWIFRMIEIGFNFAVAHYKTSRCIVYT